MIGTRAWVNTRSARKTHSLAITVMWRSVLGLSLGSAAAWNGLGNAQATTGFHPAVFSEVTGQPASDAAADGLALWLSRGLRRGTLRTYAHQLYGPGKATPPASQDGPIALALRGFQALDTALAQDFERTMMPLLRNNHHVWCLSLDVVWMPSSWRSPASAATDLPGSELLGVLGRIFSMPTSTATGPEPAGAVPFIDRGQLRRLGGDPDVGFRHGRAAYRWLRDARPGVPQPLTARLVLEAAYETVTMSLRSTFIPPSTAERLAAGRARAFQGERLDFRPAYFADSEDSAAPLPIGAVELRRVYGGPRPHPPRLRVTFGELRGDDARSLAVCRFTCDRRDPRGGLKTPFRYAPTVRVRLVGRFGSWFLRPQHLQLLVLLNDVTFALTDAGELEVLPEKSHFPVIMKTTGPLSGRYYHEITHPTMGYDLSASLTTPMIAKRLSASVRQRLAQGDADIRAESQAILARFADFLTRR